MHDLQIAICIGEKRRNFGLDIDTSSSSLRALDWRQDASRQLLE
jgi:hypothetical protein